MFTLSKQLPSVYVLMMPLCIVLGWLILQYNTLVVLGAVILLGLLALMVVWPETATLAVIFVLYTNLAVVANHFHGVSSFVVVSVYLLLALPLASYIIIKRERLIIDPAFLLMLAFLVVLSATSFLAKDINVAVDRGISPFLQEGLVLYLLVINVVRKLATLRRVIWVLLLAGSLLASLSLYQELTHSYKNTFGGLAQRRAENEPGMEEVDHRTPTKVSGSRRSAGPIGDSNRYAQMLIVLFPLALFRFWEERSRSLRICAAVATGLILCGILLSYSRGAFLTLTLLFLIMTFMRYIRPYQILTAALVLILLVAVAAPGYFTRMDTIRGVESLFSEEADVKADSSTRGRLTQMLAALAVFLDYPILGVGPGQYAPFYSKEYHLNPKIAAFKHIAKTRRAHILYFELAAETGIIGFIIFMAIVLLIMRRLWQARRRWAHSHPDLANIATAFWFSIVAYLGTAVFLQLSYQRYYWFLLALASAALHILRSEIPRAQCMAFSTSYQVPQRLSQT